jgi:hypothetical protein
MLARTPQFIPPNHLGPVFLLGDSISLRHVDIVNLNITKYFLWGDKFWVNYLNDLSFLWY